LHELRETVPHFWSSCWEGSTGAWSDEVRTSWTACCRMEIYYKRRRTSCQWHREYTANVGAVSYRLATDTWCKLCSLLFWSGKRKNS